MNIYTRKNGDGCTTTFTFVKSEELPKNIPISTPISFTFLDHRLLLVKKINGWWDIVGGKIEKGEDYLATLNREAVEEGGVDIHAHTLIGYVRADTIGNTGIFPSLSILPVTYAHIKKVRHPFIPNREVLARELVKRDEVEEFLASSDDAGQLLQMALYAFEVMRAAAYQYEFVYRADISDDMKDVQTTQAAALVRDGKGSYCAVREKGSQKFLLPGGGCKIDEKGDDCVLREIREELGIVAGVVHSLGAVHVRMSDEQGTLLSEALHRRYFLEITEAPHIPTDSEIEECVALPIDELMSVVEHLKNENGPKIRTILEDRYP
jgi:8-oxo-dGTP pyrophosphatase MutT (NUDIX family)